MLSLLRYLHTAAGEAWLRADVSVVRLVLCRSSLHINSELTAAAALAAWTAATCARLQLEPAPDTVRQTAAGCQYLVRSVLFCLLYFRTIAEETDFLEQVFDPDPRGVPPRADGLRPPDRGRGGLYPLHSAAAGHRAAGPPRAAAEDDVATSTQVGS